MITIYKYKISPRNTTMLLPLEAKVLSVESQKDDIILYALIDTSMPLTKEIEVLVYGTGHMIKHDDSFLFLGTVKLYDGNLMFHVFVKE